MEDFDEEGFHLFEKVKKKRKKRLNDDVETNFTANEKINVDNDKSRLKVELERNTIIPQRQRSLPEDAVGKNNVFNISGYKVKFPFGKRPFPSQFSVMGQTLRALHTQQNALLESPTGTGKTLALLCSSISWQQHHIRNPPIDDKNNKNYSNDTNNSKSVSIYKYETKYHPKYDIRIIYRN